MTEKKKNPRILRDGLKQGRCLSVLRPVHVFPMDVCISVNDLA